MAKISIIGAGTWGIAFVRMLSNADHEMIVWSALSAKIKEQDRTRWQKNIPNMEIPADVAFTKDIN